VEVAAFSGDAAFNNDIRRNLEKDFADNPQVLGKLLEASQSQAVHADALATQFIVDGGIAFDPATKKWVSIKKEDNFIKLAKQIEKAAEKYGLSKEQTEQIAHTYFVAKRFEDLLKKQNNRDAEIERLNAELNAENANIKQYKKMAISRSCAPLSVPRTTSRPTSKSLKRQRCLSLMTRGQ